MKNSLDFRKDVRTEEEFKNDILYATKRESFLLNYWIKTYFPHIKYENSGVDNSGALISGYTNNKPDFILHDKKSFYCEVKCNEYKHRNTFKVADLKTYIKYESKILLFYNLGYNLKNIGSTALWAFIEPEMQQKIISENPVTISDKKWGYKEVVIIKEDSFSKYFISHPL